jgi:hypothetical protein
MCGKQLRNHLYMLSTKMLVHTYVNLDYHYNPQSKEHPVLYSFPDSRKQFDSVHNLRYS